VLARELRVVGSIRIERPCRPKRARRENGFFVGSIVSVGRRNVSSSMRGETV
jgi:hypothetical protein